MRFYSEIRMEPQRHLEEILENPHLVFSTDFIYYLAILHDLDWRPNKARPSYNSYQPHPLSPCTKNVKNAMEQMLITSFLNYELLYEELVPNDAENKLELFTNRAIKILGKLTYNPMEAFFTLLHLGRWTVSFYEHGTKDAAHLVPHLMADALMKTTENSSIWFFKLDVIAEDLTEFLRYGYVESLVEECCLYFDELEDGDHFEECSMCICGHCDDLFDYNEEYKEEYGERNYLDQEYHDECDFYEDSSDECNYLDEEDYGKYENSDTESGEYLEIIEEENCEESTDSD